MSFRRLWVLTTHLPADSAVGRVVEGERADWDTDSYLLARIANLLTISNAQRSGKRPSKGDYVDAPSGPATPPPLAEKQQGWQELDKLFEG